MKVISLVLHYCIHLHIPSDFTIFHAHPFFIYFFQQVLDLISLKKADMNHILFKHESNSIPHIFIKVYEKIFLSIYIYT